MYVGTECKICVLAFCVLRPFCMSYGNFVLTLEI